MSCVVRTYLYMMPLVACFYHVTYAFHSCLNIKELLAQNRRNIWSLSDCNGTWADNHLVRTRTLNHLAKLAKRLSCVVRTNLYLIWLHFLIISCLIILRRTWHDRKIQSNASYILVITTQVIRFASLGKWSSVSLRTKWCWVQFIGVWYVLYFLIFLFLFTIFRILCLFMYSNINSFVVIPLPFYFQYFLTLMALLFILW